MAKEISKKAIIIIGYVLSLYRYNITYPIKQHKTNNYEKI